MELDKRIKDITDIKSVLNSNKEVIGKKGYLAKTIRDFKDLSRCEYNIVDDYREDDKCFCHTVKFTAGVTDTTWYPYFILEESLKSIENVYRPLTNEEFLALFDSGKLHSIRSVGARGRYIITDIYFKGDGEDEEVFVCFDCNSSYGYDMETLLKDEFEYLDNGEWKPFGLKLE